MVASWRSRRHTTLEIMSLDGRESAWLEAAREAMRVESQAIASAAERLDGNLAAAVKLIAGHGGNMVVMGVGKSGHVARKIAATLCSIGIRAVFLHPVEALHGDLGIYAPGDPTLFVSKSGSTAELLQVAHLLRSLPSPLIGILGNPAGPLATELDVVLDASVRRAGLGYLIARLSSSKQWLLLLKSSWSLK